MIIPEIVIMETGLFIKNLARQPEIIIHRGSGFHYGFAKGFVGRFPDCVSACISHKLRSPEMIIVEIVYFAATNVNPGQPACPHIKIFRSNSTVRLTFCNQIPIKVIKKDCCNSIGRLYYPLSKSVINIFSEYRRVLLHPNQPVVLIVSEHSISDAGDVAVGIIGICHRSGDLLKPVGTGNIRIRFCIIIRYFRNAVADIIVGIVDGTVASVCRN